MKRFRHLPRVRPQAAVASRLRPVGRAGSRAACGSQPRTCPGSSTRGSRTTSASASRNHPGSRSAIPFARDTASGRTGCSAIACSWAIPRRLRPRLIHADGLVMFPSWPLLHNPEPQSRAPVMGAWFSSMPPSNDSANPTGGSSASMSWAPRSRRGHSRSSRT